MKTFNVYLDYNATTPLDPVVIEAIKSSLERDWANPSSDSDIGRQAKRSIEHSRQQIADLIECEPNCIVFTSGGTEASNTAIWSAIKHCEETCGFKPHVITTNVEHDATIKLLESLKKSSIIDLTEVIVKKGSVTVDDVISSMCPNTCLITIMLANNESGVIFPVKKIIDKVKEINTDRIAQGLPKVLVHTDAAQAIGKIMVSVKELDVDYMTIVGHKFYGPRIGCLYFKRDTSPFIPLLFGGNQEGGLRPGTENTTMIVGLGQAASLVKSNLNIYSAHMQEVRDYLERKLHSMSANVIINFTECERLPNTCSVSFPGFNGLDILGNCNRLIASTGAACHSSEKKTSRVLLAMLPEEIANGTLRISVGRETTKEHIDVAVNDLIQSINRLKQKSQ